MSHRIQTSQGNRLFALAILDDADPGEVEDLIVELEATSGGVTTDRDTVEATVDGIVAQYGMALDALGGGVTTEGLRERIEALHRPDLFTDYVMVPPGTYDICAECSDYGSSGHVRVWPCATFAALSTTPPVPDTPPGTTVGEGA